MKKFDHRFGLFGGAFVGAVFVTWIIAAILSLAGTGLLVYILYRVATHPW